MTSNDKYVLEILLETGAVTAEQVETARSSIERPGISVVDVLIDTDVVPELDILGALGDQFGMEMVALREL